MPQVGGRRIRQPTQGPMIGPVRRSRLPGRLPSRREPDRRAGPWFRRPRGRSRPDMLSAGRRHVVVRDARLYRKIMASAIEFSGSDPGPAPTPQVRRGLLGRGHKLKARLTLGRQGLTETFAAHIRQCFEHTDLLKVRIDVDDRDDAQQMAAALAASIPCHLVQRTGRVALLYRYLPEADD